LQQRNGRRQRLIDYWRRNSYSKFNLSLTRRQVWPLGVPFQHGWAGGQAADGRLRRAEQSVPFFPALQRGT
jgi:hypothetical protein